MKIDALVGLVLLGFLWFLGVGAAGFGSGTIWHITVFAAVFVNCVVAGALIQGFAKSFK